MRDISQEEIAEFIREHCPVGDWDESEKVPDWVSWMMERDCIDVFTEDGEKISALICSRLSDEGHLEDNFHIDPEGNCLVIDMLLSRRRNAPLFLTSIGHFLVNKHGQPETVYWPRGTKRHKESADKLAVLLGVPTQ